MMIIQIIKMIIIALTRDDQGAVDALGHCWAISQPQYQYHKISTTQHHHDCNEGAVDALGHRRTGGV